mmetsp:Transcript_24402/g.51786  ORF Transcript_24402/g.51786 Transcript_24402/m.51786 type:complete len:83 (+) Transcript_24402:183-431(+)
MTGRIDVCSASRLGVRVHLGAGADPAAGGGRAAGDGDEAPRHGHNNFFAQKKTVRRALRREGTYYQGERQERETEKSFQKYG